MPNDTGTPSPGVRDEAFFEFLNTNVTSTKRTNTATYFTTNPGSFTVPGTIVDALQEVVMASPSAIVAAANGSIALSLRHGVIANGDPANDAGLAVNAPFTCTIFDGTTQIGQANATVRGDANTLSADCVAAYPSTVFSRAANEAGVFIPNAFHPGDTYAIILST